MRAPRGADQPITNARTANISALYPTVTTINPLAKWIGFCLFDFVIPTSMVTPSGDHSHIPETRWQRVAFLLSGGNKCATVRPHGQPKRAQHARPAALGSTVYQAHAMSAENFFVSVLKKVRG
jgi:hypothetical protein